MDFEEFFAIVERDTDVLNPTPHEKLELPADNSGVGWRATCDRASENPDHEDRAECPRRNGERS